MIKGGIIITLGGVFLLFSACSGTQQPMMDAVQTETLRAIVRQKDLETAWSQRLSTDAATSGQARGIAYNINNIVAVSSYMTGSRIYPELPGFGSLDVSLLDSRITGIITQFCNAIVNADIKKAMSLSAPHNKVLVNIFFADIAGRKLDKNYVVGKPLINDSTWQVPIRFFLTNSSKFIDIRCYFDFHNADIVVDQIAYTDFE